MNKSISQYDKRILGSLLDSYERSSLFRGENKVQVHISYPFLRKNIPEYFDESSMAYEEIHAVVKQLSERGFLQVVWKNGKENHIIEKVILQESALPEIYAYLKRTPRANQEQAALNCLKELRGQIQTPTATAFLETMYQRIAEGKSVKEYMDICDTTGMEQLIRAVAFVEQNEKECFVREFSISHFCDSKVFERLSAKVCRILKEYHTAYGELENDEILAEYQIYHTPGYVYLKGNVKLTVGKGQSAETVNISRFREGFGFSPGADFEENFSLVPSSEQIECIYTIENLTTFFRFQREKSLIIYLGGYHNGVRRNLLQAIYQRLPDAKYYHFGDIDAGGFQIFYHLREKTGIPFERYRMDLTTLKSYEQYGKALTENDRKRLNLLAEKWEDADMRKTISYMLQRNLKLEQECILE